MTDAPQTTDRLRELTAFRDEIVGIDSAESPQMQLTSWAITEIERLREALGQVEMLFFRGPDVQHPLITEAWNVARKALAHGR